MGVTEYPCPGCGTTQKVRAPNGSEVQQALCAACAEKKAKEEKPRDHSDEAAALTEEKHGAKARAR